MQRILPPIESTIPGSAQSNYQSRKVADKRKNSAEKGKESGRRDELERDTLEFRGKIRYEAPVVPLRAWFDANADRVCARVNLGVATRVDPLLPPSVILITSRDANEVVARHEGNSQRAVTCNSHSKSAKPVLTFAPQLGWKEEEKRNKRTRILRHAAIRSSTRIFFLQRVFLPREDARYNGLTRRFWRRGGLVVGRAMPVITAPVHSVEALSEHHLWESDECRSTRDAFQHCENFEIVARFDIVASNELASLNLERERERERLVIILEHCRPELVIAPRANVRKIIVYTSLSRFCASVRPLITAENSQLVRGR